MSGAIASITWSEVPLDRLIQHRKEFIRIDDLQIYKRCRVQVDAKGIVLRDSVYGSEVKTKKQQVCHAGDFLVAEIDAKMGGYGIVPKDLEGAIVSSHYFLYTIDEGKLDRKFLDFFIRTSAFRDQVAAQGSTNYAAIRSDNVLEYQIPLPPLEEQQRIVGRIEELVAKVEEARGLRSQTVQQAEILANSAASQVFSSSVHSSWLNIDQLGEVRGGIQKSSQRTPGANPRRYLTVAHVQRNKIDTGDPRYFEVSAEELERWRLLSGDVLVIEGNGSPDHIGRSALFRGEIEDCVHQNHVIRIRPNTKVVTSEYLNAFLNSPIGRDQILERSRTTSGLYTLSVGRIKSLEVPVPSTTEQQYIISYLHNLQSQVEALKKLQAQTAAELDALLPSILDKAFKGEL